MARPIGKGPRPRSPPTFIYIVDADRSIIAFSSAPLLSTFRPLSQLKDATTTLVVWSS